MLNTDNLSCSYNGMEVLSGITFNVVAGEYLGIVGPNGSGKSTLVRAILGLLKPDSGSVTLFGSPLDGFTQWPRLGYLPQRIKLFNPNFPGTVEEIVRLGLPQGGSCRFAGHPEKVRAIDDALDMMGIVHLKKRLIGD